MWAHFGSHRCTLGSRRGSHGTAPTAHGTGGPSLLCVVARGPRRSADAVAAERSSGEACSFIFYRDMVKVVIHGSSTRTGPLSASQPSSTSFSRNAQSSRPASSLRVAARRPAPDTADWCWRVQWRGMLGGMAGALGYSYCAASRARANTSPTCCFS